MTDEQDDALIDRLAKAGGIAGPSNRQWWLDLVESYGEGLVVELVTAKRAATRQPVSVAVIAKLASDKGARRQQEIDDAAEDAAMGRQVARTSNTSTSNKSQGTPTATASASTGKGAAAAADVEPSPTAAAVGDHPSTQPTTEQKRQAAAKPYGLTEEDKAMATCKQLLKSIEAEIARRGITVKDAMVEMGVATTAIYGWRKEGKISEVSQQKINNWLLRRPVTISNPPDDVTKAETEAIERHQPQTSNLPLRENVFVAPSLPSVPMTFGLCHDARMPLSDSLASAHELLTQGANLADHLRALGANGYADVVTTLVERLRTVRAALSV